MHLLHPFLRVDDGDWSLLGIRLDEFAQILLYDHRIYLLQTVELAQASGLRILLVEHTNEGFLHAMVDVLSEVAEVRLLQHPSLIIFVQEIGCSMEYISEYSSINIVVVGLVVFAKTHHVHVIIFQLTCEVNSDSRRRDADGLFALFWREHFLHHLVVFRHFVL